MHWFLLIPIIPYLFILLKIYRYLLGIQYFTPDTRPDLKVSVIIPCKNESSSIGFLLGDLAAQTYPGDDFEVIVVDDNSTDRTFETASSFTGIKRIQVLKSRSMGKKMAIRTGTEAATGELIITTDADCRAGVNWISTVAAFYCRYRPDLIICPVVLESRRGFTGRFQELEFLGLQGITAGSAAGNRSTMCNGANLAFRRSIYSKHSHNLRYEINSGDDIFLLHSVKKEKEPVIRWLESGDAMVTTSQANTLSGFLTQRKRWISKATGYRDRFTILLGIVTFVTIFSEVALLIASFLNVEYLVAFSLFFLLKSVPDYLILKNTTCRYGKKELMRWFLPSSLVYPFYVLIVIFYPWSALPRKGD